MESQFFTIPSLLITILLGEPSLLKQLLKTPVVFNLRENDLNNGGLAAPLIPIYHESFI